MERKLGALAATVNDGHYDGWGTEWGYQDPPGWPGDTGEVRIDPVGNTQVLQRMPARWRLMG